VVFLCRLFSFFQQIKPTLPPFPFLPLTTSIAGFLSPFWSLPRSLRHLFLLPLRTGNGQIGFSFTMRKASSNFSSLSRERRFKFSLSFLFPFERSVAEGLPLPPPEVNGPAPPYQGGDPFPQEPGEEVRSTTGGECIRSPPSDFGNLFFFSFLSVKSSPTSLIG